MNHQPATNQSSSLTPFQSGLARRVVMYWCVTWLIVFTLPIMVRMYTEQLPFNQLASGIIEDFWFPAVVSFLALPVVVLDSIRFAGKSTQVA